MKRRLELVIDTDLLNEMDKSIAESGEKYQSRAHFIRCAISKQLNKEAAWQQKSE